MRRKSHVLLSLIFLVTIARIVCFTSLPRNSLGGRTVLRASVMDTVDEIALGFRGKAEDFVQKALVKRGKLFLEHQQPPADASSGSKIGDFSKVPGCVANVNVRVTLHPSGEVSLEGNADAILSRGLLAVVSEVCDGRNSSDILALEPTQLADLLGLRLSLSRGRNDGLANILKIIQGQIHFLMSNSSNVIESMDSSVGTKPTVGLLLSGGVDSSVALNLLLQDGYDVTAFYLKIWLEDELAHLGQCPWEDDYRMCEAVCEQAGVKLETISLQEEYKAKVISYTVQEAEQGRTPNPDIMCNSRVKFGCFYDAIEARNFDYIASGHYAQLSQDEETGKRRMFRAPDAVKDQSYFLCALTQDQLDRVLFPIGHLEKSEVRSLADDFMLPNRKRADSQGLCFLGKVKFDEFLGAYLGEKPGAILDASNGDNLGTHRGLWYHTVGQRKGIGPVLDPLATSRGPWYVVTKDPKTNVLFCTNKYDEDIFDSARSEFTVENLHWISGHEPLSLEEHDECRYTMKIRHGPRLVSGTLRVSEKCRHEGDVKLECKDGGLAPGQFVVFYDGEECLGSGVISERHWARFLMDREVDLAM